jgi:hypothetical protein
MQAAGDVLLPPWPLQLVGPPGLERYGQSIQRLVAGTHHAFKASDVPDELRHETIFLAREYE